MKTCCIGPRFLTRPNLSLYSILSTSIEAMLHIRNLMGSHHSPKMTKNTPKIEAFPLALLKSGSHHFAAALNSYSYPICDYILSHPHSGRLHRIFVTPGAPSKTQNDQRHLKSTNNKVVKIILWLS